MPPGFVNNGVLLDRSAIKVESCAVVGSDLRVAIMDYTGHSYQLQCSDDLRPDSWTNLGFLQAGHQVLLVMTHTNGFSAGQRFYRVAVDPTGGSD